MPSDLLDLLARIGHPNVYISGFHPASASPAQRRHCALGPGMVVDLGCDTTAEAGK
jgi:hypothetical protein